MSRGYWIKGIVLASIFSWTQFSKTLIRHISIKGNMITYLRVFYLRSGRHSTRPVNPILLCGTMVLLSPS